MLELHRPLRLQLRLDRQTASHPGPQGEHPERSEHNAEDVPSTAASDTAESRWMIPASVLASAWKELAATEGP